MQCFLVRNVLQWIEWDVVGEVSKCGQKEGQVRVTI